MALPLESCEPQTPCFPQGPRPPVPQRPQPFPPLHDRIVSSQSLSLFPRPTHHNSAARATHSSTGDLRGKGTAHLPNDPSKSDLKGKGVAYYRNDNSSRGDLKGKGVAYYPNNTYRSTLTKNTSSPSEVNTASPTEQFVARYLPTTNALASERGPHHNLATEASTSHTTRNQASTPQQPKRTKLLPIFENTDSSLEESSNTPLSLHKEPRTLDLPLKDAQAGPKKPTVVQQSQSHSTQEASIVEEEASVVEAEAMTNSRGSPEPPRRKSIASEFILNRKLIKSQVYVASQCD